MESKIFHNCKLSFLGIRRQPRLITTTDLFQIWLWVKIYWYHSGNGDHFSPTMLVDNAGSLEFWWVLTTLRHRGSCKGYQPGGKCRGAAMFFHGGSPGVGDDFFYPCRLMRLSAMRYIRVVPGGPIYWEKKLCPAFEQKLTQTVWSSFAGWSYMIIVSVLLHFHWTNPLIARPWHILVWWFSQGLEAFHSLASEAMTGSIY